MVISAAVGAVPLSLSGNAATKLAAPQHQRFIQQTALLQVRDQRGAGLIRVATARDAPRTQAGVMIPIGMEQLHKADATLHQRCSELAS